MNVTASRSRSVGQVARVHVEQARDILVGDRFVLAVADAVT
jgi:hypothetical protein